MRVEESKLRSLFRSLGVDTVDGWDVQKLTAKANRDGGVAAYYDEEFPIKSAEDAELFEVIRSEQARGELVEVAVGTVGRNGNGDGRGADEEDSGVFDLTEPGEFAASATTADSGNGDGHARAVTGTATVGTTGTAVAVKSPRQRVERAAKPTEAERPGVRVTKSPRKGRRGVSKAPPQSFAERMNRARERHGKTLPLSDRAVVAWFVVTLLQKAGQKKAKGVTKTELHAAMTKKFDDRDPKQMWTYLQNLVPTRLTLWYGFKVRTEKNAKERLYWIEVAK